MSRARTQSETTVHILPQLLDNMATGRIHVPRALRPFAWDVELRLELLRSIHRGRPIGGLVTLSTTLKEPVLARLGPCSLPPDEAPPTALRTYLVDGLNRCTTLLGVFDPRNQGTEPHWFDDAGRQWRTYFDLEHQDFVVPDVEDSIDRTWIPLHILLDNRRLVQWSAKCGSEELRRQATALARIFHNTNIVVTSLRTEDSTELRELIEQYNGNDHMRPGTDDIPPPLVVLPESSSPSAGVRKHLRTALAADLVGPFDQADPDARETLPLPPSRWYLTGFLAPERRRDVQDPTEDDELAAGDDSDEQEDGNAADPLPKQRKVFPASLGLSVLLPPGDLGPLTAHVRWADYLHTEIEPDPARDGERKRKLGVWVRHPRGPIPVSIPLDPARLQAGLPVEGAPGVVLIGQLGDAAGQGLDGGTRALSLFLVNQRSVPEDRRPDEGFLFQVELELSLPQGFIARPNRTGEASRDIDERVAELQYRDRREYAVGHGASAVIADDAPRFEGRPTRARTCWLPVAEVQRVATFKDDRVETGMDALAALAGADAPARLGPLVELYGAWLKDQAAIPLDSTDREDTRRHLLREAETARQRIARGIDLLARDPQVCRAFGLANAAMAMSARRRFGEQATPRWHLFQLAFLLLNLESVADPRSDHRDDVELIFFPTGGGKTEAYLGVIAFTLLLRRLRGAARPDAGLGVAVLLRYTLRLLTLDQLARAATLMCALELLRQQHAPELGGERLSIGLWVGRSATANTLAEVARKVTEYKNNRAPSPFPLTQCPWCGKDLKPDSMTLWPKATKPEEVRVSCVHPECAFSGRSTRGDGLPILFVDEQIYRELPCFLVATVDKFAMLPWRGDTGMLFGRVTAREGRHFTGPLDGKPARGATLLPSGVRPPELIVQDELHLISGPLGTMVGLYETAIEALATDRTQAPPVRPKILASTATVRRAGKQIQALFGRARTNLFPPPGVDAFETWFATLDKSSPGRQYIGVAAPGRAMKAILLRTYVALLGAAARVYDRTGPEDQPADAYMTVAGYFNSLRELGGMRRLVEDDVRTRCAQAEARVPRDAVGPHPYVKRRELLEPVELTSRESTATIAQTKARLGLPHPHDRHVDVLLASNMISVGVDIDRLGLMVVAGQPKTTSEYIQASSRVGRQPKWPGLVVTCFNVHKPRDRSHYERFVSYHESFYRYVEAQSLTPFSAPAVERGLAGVLTALVRLGEPAMTPPAAAMDLDEHRAFADRMAALLGARAAEQPGLVHGKEDAAERLEALATNLLDAWSQLITRARKEAAAQRIYSPYDKPRPQGKPILHTPLDKDDSRDSDEQKFSAPTSMRDVEAGVHLWVERYQLGGRR